MKAKIKYLMLALVAVFACACLSSCSKDDDDPNKGIGNYYFQLSSVDTNCVGTDGKSVANALKEEWISSNNADTQGKISIGKCDNETAKNWFDQEITTLVDAYNTAYAGKGLLPDNGYIRYTFYLGSDASYGGATSYATIEVTNSGAKKN